MNTVKVGWGIVLLILGIGTFISYLDDYTYAPVFYVLNGLILLGWGVYFTFLNKKKDVVLENGKMVITKGAKRLEVHDLAKKERIVQGHRGIKIVFQEYTATFDFSGFNRKSVETLKSLT